MSELPAVLKVESLGEGRWSAPHPADDPEGRDVVFSGQVLAQMIMASDAAVESQKEVKSIHAIFARAGTYSAGLMELRLEPMHSGRAWGSDTITAYQGDRLLSRGLVLLNTVEPDLMRHSPVDARRPRARGLRSESVDHGVPRRRGAPGRPARRGRRRRITRHVLLDAHAGVVRLGGGQPGRDRVDPARLPHRAGHASALRHREHRRCAHARSRPGSSRTPRTSTTTATSASGCSSRRRRATRGNGRVFGSGAVFTHDGQLVSTFAQDSMARGVEGPIDPKRGM